ncbi:MAG: hypothetical protein GY835_18305 [bacterium]|nr:hypothetical protein [bacterium]
MIALTGYIMAATLLITGYIAYLLTRRWRRNRAFRRNMERRPWTITQAPRRKSKSVTTLAGFHRFNFNDGPEPVPDRVNREAGTLAKESRS